MAHGAGECDVILVLDKRGDVVEGAWRARHAKRCGSSIRLAAIRKEAILWKYYGRGSVLRVR